MTVTLGIDLAAQPKNTAVALLDWTRRRPRVNMLCRGHDDDGAPLDDHWLVDLVCGAQAERVGEVTKVGIDDPFGWPVPFVEALAGHRRRPTWPSGLNERLDPFRLRTTDRIVHKRSGRWPLSVSSNWIALPAMRCAVLLAAIARRQGEAEVARVGSGLCCEVYPDPALRAWTEGTKAALGRASYKGKENAGKRIDVLATLREQLPFEDPGNLLAKAELEDDYLDAIICALVARAVELDRTYLPNRDQARLAETEGWIHLPCCELSELRGGTGS